MTSRAFSLITVYLHRLGGNYSSHPTLQKRLIKTSIRRQGKCTIRNYTSPRCGYKEDQASGLSSTINTVSPIASWILSIVWVPTSQTSVAGFLSSVEPAPTSVGGSSALTETSVFQLSESTPEKANKSYSRWARPPFFSGQYTIGRSQSRTHPR